jgi:hypothetical protein
MAFNQSQADHVLCSSPSQQGRHCFWLRHIEPATATRPPSATRPSRSPVPAFLLPILTLPTVAHSTHPVWMQAVIPSCVCYTFADDSAYLLRPLYSPAPTLQRRPRSYDYTPHQQACCHHNHRSNVNMIRKGYTISCFRAAHQAVRCRMWHQCAAWTARQTDARVLK